MVQVRADGPSTATAGPCNSSSEARSPAGFPTGENCRGLALLPPSPAIAGPLDLHEGISPPRLSDPRTGCLRWPEHQRLLNETTGEIVLGRCKATNLCPYCQRLFVIETLEMLALDAAEYAPTLWFVLTAREHLTRVDTYRHLEHLLRSARRRWPVEWFVQVEFQRRGALHLNLLVKGVNVVDRQELHGLVVERWCARIDAEPVGQWSGEVTDGGGVMRYLQKTLAHGLKQEQAPPLGWRGHRTSQTRGYLVRPASVMRQEARQALALKRELWKAIANGYVGQEAELVAQLAIAAKSADDWRLYALKRKSGPGVQTSRQRSDGSTGVRRPDSAIASAA